MIIRCLNDISGTVMKKVHWMMSEGNMKRCLSSSSSTIVGGKNRDKLSIPVSVGITKKEMSEDIIVSYCFHQ